MAGIQMYCFAGTLPGVFAFEIIEFETSAFTVVCFEQKCRRHGREPSQLFQ